MFAAWRFSGLKNCSGEIPGKRRSRETRGPEPATDGRTRSLCRTPNAALRPAVSLPVESTDRRIPSKPLGVELKITVARNRTLPGPKNRLLAWHSGSHARPRFSGAIAGEIKKREAFEVYVAGFSDDGGDFLSQCERTVGADPDSALASIRQDSGR